MCLGFRAQRDELQHPRSRSGNQLLRGQESRVPARILNPGSQTPTCSRMGHWMSLNFMGISSRGTGAARGGGAVYQSGGRGAGLEGGAQPAALPSRAPAARAVQGLHCARAAPGAGAGGKYYMRLYISDDNTCPGGNNICVMNSCIGLGVCTSCTSPSRCWRREFVSVSSRVLGI